MGSMRSKRRRFLLAILGFFVLATQAQRTKAKDAVRLDSIQALTFRKDKLTTHRRLSAIPQLTCAGGSAKGLFEPDTVRCKNAGSSYSTADIEWTCTASLPPEFKLGSTDVVCEGYDSPDDDFILKGSCGLEYRLILTQAGEDRYGKLNWWGGRSGGRESLPSSSSGHKTGLISDAFANAIFWLIFAAVVIFMIYGAWNNGNNQRHGRAPRRNFGAGYRPDNDDDNDNDPPPPYTPSARQYRKTSARTSSSSTQNTGWRPGFWSGLAAGAAGGYYARTRAQPRPQRQYPAQESGSWFGGGRSSADYDPGEGSSRYSGSFSSGRYESTGFGGTRRR